VALCYPFRGARSRWQRREAEAAALVIGLRWQLRSVGVQTWSTDLASVLRWGGLNARRIGEIFGYSRDTVLRRARADEAKLDSLFGHLLPPEPPPLRQPRFSGCIIEVEDRNPAKPFQLDDADVRARLADEYRAKAVVRLLDGFCSRCRIDPKASEYVQK
jgi:hypothetical protein